MYGCSVGAFVHVCNVIDSLFTFICFVSFLFNKKKREEKVHIVHLEIYL